MPDTRPKPGLPTSVWTKLTVWLVVIPACVFFGSSAAAAVALIVLVISAVVLRAPVRRVARALASYLVPLAAVFGLILLLTRKPDEALLWEWLLTIGRFAALLGFGLLFSLTTTPLDLVQGLRRIGMPQPVAVGVMAAYRTVPLLSERLETIIAAQRARGARWKSLNPLRIARLLLSLGVPVVYATTDIALALADSLHLRGYRPNRRMTVPPVPLFRIGDFVVFGLAAIVVVAAFS